MADRTKGSISKTDFQHVYESLNFEDVKWASGKHHVTPSSIAQTQRRIAAQLYYAANSGKTEEDPAVAQALLDRHLSKYFQIVDEKDANKGLDNYSKGALALSSSFKNESKQWSLKDLRSSKIFQTLECDLKKVSSLPCSSIDLDRSLELVANLESTGAKTEVEAKPAPTPFITKLRPMEPEINNHRTEVEVKPTPTPFVPKVRTVEPVITKPIPKVQPVNPQVKYQPPAPARKSEEPPQQPSNNNFFRSAKEQLIIDQRKQNQGGQQNGGPSYGTGRPKSLGTRRGLNSPFILPVKQPNQEENPCSNGGEANKASKTETSGIVDERLKNIEPKMVELIENEIMDNGAPVNWDDIAGLEFAKATIKEIVVWPMLRPDIFTGLRGPPKGILLFGPPGTGKTLIGKCIASQSKSTFFSISASSLTSKWVGEGEKMVRALFAVARVHQPSVIFIDEIDSLLSQRGSDEHESSRRIKTEFLVQLDGATTSSDDRLLVVGATNRPQELDEAARRRLVKRLYIPLPEFPARKQIIELLMASQRHALTEESVDDICHRTDGYSCADMTNLCKEAAYGPIRSIALEDIEHITPDQVRPIMNEDFEAALSQVRASVSTQDLALYEDWNSRYGSGAK